MSTDIQMYSVSNVQNGLLERKTASRIVPPPTAVTIPTIEHPNTSNPDWAAVTLPVSANVSVPR
eukprot:CAMPEP_0197446598 /NCGR_PEP_ID=MMETSP1175-20131217/11515_1 /TAXON_ID=1003142 /ORGANISM="Triceratium dubium, Strain CCMP147" /LENGTH=63 /DNA_ID=CAMNT_0042977745 /DNA_START=541 /DNA_END=732 /DNA_ORIENTATION=-